PKDEAVVTGTDMLAMSFPHVGIVDVGHGCDLERAVLDTNALLLVREGDDLAVAAVGDEGGAARTGSMPVEKARQDVHGDVGRCAAKEFDAAENRNPQ